MNRRAVALACALYFAALIALIAATVVFDIDLAQGEGWFRLPTGWSLLLAAMYYAAPIAVAAVVGYLRRPMRKHFVATVTVIFAVHAAYSVAVAGMRLATVKVWRADIEQSHEARPVVAEFGHRFVDDDDDGLVNRVVLEGRLDADHLPFGAYTLYARASHGGAPGVGFGYAEVVVAIDAEQVHEFAYEVDARYLRDLAEAGPFDIHLGLSRHFTVSPTTGKRIVALCRSAAFLCPTSRLGYDPVLYDDIVEIARFDAVDTVALAPETIQRNQLVFMRYLGDTGRDDDGDGLFDALIVSIELDSIYAGPLYIQAQIAGAASGHVQQTSPIGKGIGQFDVVLDGGRLRALGRDGPYTLGAFALLNNDPYCPGGACVIENRPVFTVYLDAYTTKAYRAEQFE